MTAHSTYVIKVSILTEGGGGVKKGHLNLENENNQLMNLLSLISICNHMRPSTIKD